MYLQVLGYNLKITLTDEQNAFYLDEISSFHKRISKVIKKVGLFDY